MIRLGGEMQRKDLDLKTSEIEGRARFFELANQTAPDIYRWLFRPWNLEDLPDGSINRFGDADDLWMRLCLLHAKDPTWFDIDPETFGAGPGVRNCVFMAYFDYLHRNNSEFEKNLKDAKNELAGFKDRFGSDELVFSEALRRFIPDWKTLKTKKEAVGLCREIEAWGTRFELRDEWIFDLVLESLATLRGEIDKFRLPENYITSRDTCWELRQMLFFGSKWKLAFTRRSIVRFFENSTEEIGIPSNMLGKLTFRYEWPRKLPLKVHS